MHGEDDEAGDTGEPGIVFESGGAGGCRGEAPMPERLGAREHCDATEVFRRRIRPSALSSCSMPITAVLSAYAKYQKCTPAYHRLRCSMSMSEAVPKSARFNVAISTVPSSFRKESLTRTFPSLSSALWRSIVRYRLAAVNMNWHTATRSVFHCSW